MARSHRLRVCRLQLVAHFGLAFATASCLKTLNLAADEQLAGSLCKRHAVSRLRSKLLIRPPTACRHTVSGSIRHSPPGVLFTFPSRYLFAIGHERVFSLTRWSSQIPTGFHVSCGTWDAIRSQRAFAYGAVTL